MKLQKLYDILLSDSPREELLLNENEVFELIPELEKCKGFNQNSKWHVYDVYEHILHVVDYVPRDIVLRLAALFHDIGKPLSYKEDEFGSGHFYGHWEISKNIFDDFSIKYNIAEDISKVVSNLIYYHDINIDKLNEGDVKKLYDILGINGIELLYKLKEADLLSQNKKYHYILKDYHAQKQRILQKYMSGNF